MNPHEPDRIWEHLRLEARAISEREPILGTLVNDRILLRSDFWDALATVLSRRLAEDGGEQLLQDGRRDDVLR